MIENWWQLCLVLLTVTLCVVLGTACVLALLEARGKDKKDG